MKKTIILSSFLFLGILAFSQTSVNSSGGSVSNTSGSISYSVGQIVYHTVTNTTGSVTQGVQQVYDISALNLEENTFNFSLSAYPNPTVDNLTLKVGNFSQLPLNYKLVDLTGKLISEGVISEQETVLETKV